MLELLRINSSSKKLLTRRAALAILEAMDNEQYAERKQELENKIKFFHSELKTVDSKASPEWSRKTLERCVHQAQRELYLLSQGSWYPSIQDHGLAAFDTATAIYMGNKP